MPSDPALEAAQEIQRYVWNSDDESVPEMAEIIRRHYAASSPQPEHYAAPGKCQECERLKDILHQDRSGLAEALVTAKKLAESRMWIVAGRGSYEWDDERYRREAGWALKEIVEHCRIALETSGNLAHAECCGRKSHAAVASSPQPTVPAAPEEKP